MRTGELLMLGDIIIDTVWPVNEMPEPGRDAFVGQVQVGLGGAALNSAILLDRLGLPVGMLGCLGVDLWAQQVRDLLSRTGVNLSYVKESGEAGTGLIFIIVTPDGERTMFTYRGANTHLKPQDLDPTTFEQAGLLHISGYALLESPQKDAVWEAVRLAKLNHATISLDTGLEPAMLNPDDLHRLMGEVDICITGLKEMEELFGINDPQAAAKKLLSLGVRLAAIKLGEQGCCLADGRECCFFPAFKITTVDTTGAGDSFTAGLLYGWMRGLSLQASAVLASVLGALAATVYGAGLSLPHPVTVLEFLKYQLQKDASGRRAVIEEVIAALKKE